MLGLSGGVRFKFWVFGMGDRGKALGWAIPLRGGCANDLALVFTIAKATGDPPAPPFGVASPNPR
jgi:hypothetical protein